MSDTFSVIFFISDQLKPEVEVELELGNDALQIKLGSINSNSCMKT